MKTHKYRISEAAVGKILTKVMEMTRSAEISSAQFHDTMFATLNYIEDEVEPSQTANINLEKWQYIKALIDKSARRSKAARERAARRRQSLIVSSRHEVGENYPEIYQPSPSSRMTPSDAPNSATAIRPDVAADAADSTPVKDSAAAKAERERLERLSREYDEVCKRCYW